MFENDPEKKLRLLGACLHALGLLIAAGTAVAAHALLWVPLAEEVNEAGNQHTTVQAKFDGAMEARLEHRRLLTTLAKIERDAAALQRRIPEEPLEADFLAELTKAAQQVNLQIQNYQPGVVTVEPTCSQLEIVLSGVGSHRSICGFLDRLTRSPRLSRVLTLEIDSAADGGLYPVSMKLVIFFDVKQQPEQPQVT